MQSIEFQEINFYNNDGNLVGYAVMVYINSENYYYKYDADVEYFEPVLFDELDEVIEYARSFGAVRYNILGAHV